jgi:outer membrane lipoprotein-sorting protein
MVAWLAMLLGVAEAGTPDTNAVIDAWIAAQAGAKTWSAEFTQTRSLKALTQPLVSSGRVWFAAPDRFRWELGDPPQTIAVRNADEMLVIYPRLKRAERYPLAGPQAGRLGEALALLDAGLPQNRATFDARFRVPSLQETNGVWQVELQPTAASLRRMLPAIRVTLATNDFRLLVNELVFPDGSSMRNEFTHPNFNAALDENLFRPPLDVGTKVTEPRTK